MLKTEHIELKEFDKALPLDDLIQEFQKAGYSDDFIGDLKKGFTTSEIYSEESDDKR